MRVICIDNKNPKRPHLLMAEDWIYKGEIYTVQHSYTDKRDGHVYYYLKERRHRAPAPSYRATRFIPLSEVDDETLIKSCSGTKQKDICFS